MIAPASPITGTPAQRVDTLRSDVLVRRYREEWGLDVATTFKGRDRIELYRCPDTGYRFFHPAELAAEESIYDQIGSEEFAARHGASPEWKADWQFGLDQLELGERILDVGCSDGGFLVRASQIARASGLEGNAMTAARARQRGLDVACGFVQDHARDHAGTFDKVLAFQVLEHIYAVRPFVDGMVALLRPGGKIVLAVPNCDPWFAVWDKYDPLNNPPHHIGLWNRAALEGLARECGLTVETVALLGPGASFRQRVYRRAAYWAGVKRASSSHSPWDWLCIAGAAPFALLAESLFQPGHAGDIAVVLRKPGSADLPASPAAAS